MGSLTKAVREERAAVDREEEWSDEAVIYVNGLRRVLPDGLAHLTLLQYLRGRALAALLSLSLCFYFIYLFAFMETCGGACSRSAFLGTGIERPPPFFLITRNSLTPDSDPAPVESLWLAAFSLLKKSYTYRSKGVVRGDRLVEFLKLSNWNRQDVRPAWFMSGTIGPMI
jgi:hypothetical protein